MDCVSCVTFVELRCVLYIYYKICVLGVRSNACILKRPATQENAQCK